MTKALETAELTSQRRAKLEAKLSTHERTYWLELLSDSGVVAMKRLLLLQTEADELIRILVTMVKKVKLSGKPRRSALRP